MQNTSQDLQPQILKTELKKNRCCSPISSNSYLLSWCGSLEKILATLLCSYARGEVPSISLPSNLG